MADEDYIYEIIIDLPRDAANIKVKNSLDVYVFDISISGINKISNIAIDIKDDVIPIIDKILNIFKSVS